MAAPIQFLGTAVVVPANTTLIWTAVITDGSTTTTLTSADGESSVETTLTAGTYSPHGFINHCGKKIRQSLFTRLSADAWVTTDPSSAAAITFKLGMPSTGAAAGVGATPLRIYCDALGGALKAGVAVKLQSFTINNSTNNNWGMLGLAYIAETRVFTASGAGVLDDTGRFQPRWMFCLRASYNETAAIEHPGHYSELLDDGTVFQYSFGAGPARYRDLSLETHPQHIVGPPWIVGLSLGTFGATRNILNLQTMDETLFAGISGVDRRTDNLTAPAYLATGKWWARYRQTTGNTFEAMDVWPSTRTPKVGEPIYVYPEAIALIEEWKRTGLLFRYSAKDLDGSTTWLAEALAPNKKGAWRMEPRRRGGNSLYWSLDLPGLIVPSPQLSVP